MFRWLPYASKTPRVQTPPTKDKTMTQNFPSNLTYDYAGAKEPYLLDAGYFVALPSVLDLFEESTSDNGDGYPTALTDEGEDFFILSAGSTFMGKSMGVTWYLRLLTAKGSVIQLEGVHPNGYQGGVLVAQSHTPASFDHLY